MKASYVAQLIIICSCQLLCWVGDVKGINYARWSEDDGCCCSGGGGGRVGLDGCE